MILIHTDQIPDIGTEGQNFSLIRWLPSHFHGLEMSIIDRNANLLDWRDEISLAIVILTQNRSKQSHQGLSPDW